MKRHSKKIIITAVLLCSLVIAISLMAKSNTTIQGQTTSDTFLQLLSSNNITVAGQPVELTQFQLNGLVETIKPEYTDIIIKYMKLLEDNKATHVLTPIQLFELEYYSNLELGQEQLLNKVSNQTITITSKDNCILLSYNVE